MLVGRRSRFLIASSAFALLGGCGSGLPNSLRGSDGAGSTRRFSGTITARPQVRRIHLDAGEALRLWVRPNAGNRGEMTLEVASNLQALPTAGAIYPHPYGDILHEQRNDFFFSDYSRATDRGVGDLARYGSPLVQTGSYCDPSQSAHIGVNPLFFADFGTGFGDVAEGESSGRQYGSWIAFVAPQGGTYTLFVAGTGAFSGGYSTHRSPIRPSHQNGSFDNTTHLAAYSAPEWMQVVREQFGFLYADSGYASGGYHADPCSPADHLTGRKGEFSPSAHRHEVTALLTRYAAHMKYDLSGKYG